MKNEKPKLVDISTAANMLGVHPITLRRWDKRGILKPIRMGARQDRRYRKETIEKIIKKGI